MSWFSCWTMVCSRAPEYTGMSSMEPARHSSQIPSYEGPANLDPRLAFHAWAWFTVADAAS